jgi:hypothetical protein
MRDASLPLQQISAKVMRAPQVMRPSVRMHVLSLPPSLPLSLTHTLFLLQDWGHRRPVPKAS